MEGGREKERERERERTLAYIPVVTAPEAEPSLFLKSTSSEFSTSPLDMATTRLAVRAALATWPKADYRRDIKPSLLISLLHTYTVLLQNFYV